MRDAARRAAAPARPAPRGWRGSGWCAVRMDREASGARLELAGRVRRQPPAPRLDACAVAAEVLASEQRGRAQVDHAGAAIDPEPDIVGEAPPAGLELGVQAVRARRDDAGAGRRLDRHAQGRHGGRAFTREAERRAARAGALRMVGAVVGLAGNAVGCGRSWPQPPAVYARVRRRRGPTRQAAGSQLHTRRVLPVMWRAPHAADRGPPGRPRPGVAARAFARHKQPPDCSCLAKGRASRASWPVRPARPRPSMADRTLSGRHGCSSGKRQARTTGPGGAGRRVRATLRTSGRT